MKAAMMSWALKPLRTPHLHVHARTRAIEQHEAPCRKDHEHSVIGTVICTEYSRSRATKSQWTYPPVLQETYHRLAL
jgi:hypothetical protein